MGSILTKLFTKKSTLKSLFGNRKKVVGSTFLAVIFICGGSKTTSEKIQHNFASLTSETSILMLRGGGLKLVFRMKDYLRLIAEAVEALKGLLEALSCVTPLRESFLFFGILI